MRMASSLLALIFGLSVAGSALATDAATPGSSDPAVTSESQPAQDDVKKVSKQSKKTKKTKKKAKKKAKSTQTADEADPPAVQ